MQTSLWYTKCGQKTILGNIQKFNYKIEKQVSNH